MDDENVDYNNLEFHEKLGEGGGGTVSRVIFKKPFKGYTEAAAKAVWDLREEEVEIMRKLHHPHIVEWLAFYKNGPLNLILLEYGGNGSLHDYLSDKTKPLPEILMRKWLKESALAIKYLHGLSVLHRDIKPHNCILFDNNILKLCDFGLARTIDRSQTLSTAEKGTYSYMAPEIYMGNEEGRAVYSKPADIYSYGMLTLQIAKRKPPWEEVQFATVMFKVTSGERPAIPSTCPQDISEMIQRCWDDDPKKRPTIQDIVDDLNRSPSVNEEISLQTEGMALLVSGIQGRSEDICIPTEKRTGTPSMSGDTGDPDTGHHDTGRSEEVPTESATEEQTGTPPISGDTEDHDTERSENVVQPTEPATEEQTGTPPMSGDTGDPDTGDHDAGRSEDVGLPTEEQTSTPPMSGDTGDHDTESSEGICCKLSVPCPKKITFTEGTDKSWEIPRKSLMLEKKIIKGQFGEIWRGQWKSTPVSIKIKHGTSALHEFLKETHIMKKLSHRNILRLYAVCSEKMPLYIVTEFMLNGFLNDYLSTENGLKLNLKELTEMGAQIAAGMDYIGRQDYVHCDVHARNILVGDTNICKISNFGLARKIPDDLNEKGAITMLIKWNAPEVIFDGTFSIKSDVWSFGVLLYELITHGKEPYPDITDTDSTVKVMKVALKTGYRMPQPDKCPDALYELMRKCWQEDPVSRPTFDFLNSYLDDFFVATEPIFKSKDVCLPTEEQSGTQPMSGDAGDDGTGRPADLGLPIEEQTGTPPMSGDTGDHDTGRPKYAGLSIEEQTGTQPKSGDAGDDDTGRSEDVGLPIEEQTGTPPKPGDAGDDYTAGRSEDVALPVKEQTGTPPMSGNTGDTGVHNTVKMYIAVCDFNAVLQDGLSFRKGDILEVIDTTTGDDTWWLASSTLPHKKGYGYVPCNYIAPYKEDIKEEDITKEDWYFGEISRGVAELTLLTPGLKRGTFLIRGTESSPGSFYLSVRDHDSPGDPVNHYEILRQDQGFYITDSTRFTSLVELVKHYQQSSEGICCRLSVPCPKKITFTEGTDKSLEIPRKSLILEKKIVDGQFGEIWQGLHLGQWKSTPVSIKIKRGTSAPQEFLKETHIMKKLSHQNILRLYAVCSEEMPIYIVTELMLNGCLRDYLRTENGLKLNLKDLVEMGLQIAAGMDYFGRQNYIHCDVAARNILVGDNNICKVANFVLAREMPFLHPEGPTTVNYPIRWIAPEIFRDGNFTIKSDVWSFGVLLYELITYGKLPYPGMTNKEVQETLVTGYRMPQPDKCPDALYELMTKCWQEDPVSRPTFEFLKTYLDDFFVATEPILK